MPTIPKTTKDVNELNSVDVLNSIRSELGASYADVVPMAYNVGDVMANGAVATSADAVASLRAIGTVMTTFQPMANMFLNTLVNRIARVIITSRLYSNPWARFKKGLLEYGETVEDIFVEIAKPYQFNQTKEGSTVFKKHVPDTKSAFYSMNYQKYYPTTVSNDMLRTAFLSMEGVTDLISRIIQQVYTGANYDEFLVMKYMIARMALAGNIYPVEIEEVTAANARTITTSMVNYARKLGYMSNQYNMAGVMTYTDISSLYTILTTDIESVFDVEVLALSFHMEKAELLGRQIGVDGFGTIDADRLALIFADDPYTDYTPFTPTELTELATLQALMVDENWFMIFENYRNMTEIYNPEELYWNYFYHVWETFATSPFANAIAFTTSTPAVTAVSVTPPTASANKGATVQLTATVTATGFANKKVSWEITGSPTDSSVDQNGLVSVGANETLSTLTVQATSTYDSTKTGQATITVNQG